MALFFAPTDVDGLPVWYLMYWFGNTNETPNSDLTGDGFTISNDMALGYSPVVSNLAVNGGEIMRLSDPTTFLGTTNAFYYSIQSDPANLISNQSGYVSPGTPVVSPDISYGIGYSGYKFGYWSINGNPQTTAAGVSQTQAILPMTNDESAVAHFLFGLGYCDQR